MNASAQSGKKRFDRDFLKITSPQVTSIAKRSAVYKCISDDLSLPKSQVHAVGEALIEHMDTKNPAIKKFKFEMTVLDMHLLAQMFAHSNMTRYLFAPGIEYLEIVADELILQAAANGRIDDLADTINECALIIAPCKPLSIILGASGIKIEPVSNIFTREQHIGLLTAVLLSSPDTLFEQVIEPFRGDPEMGQTFNTIVDAHAHKQKIWALLKSFLPNTYRKRATKTFLKNTSAILGEFAKQACEQETQQKQKLMGDPFGLPNSIALASACATNMLTDENDFWLRDLAAELSQSVIECSSERSVGNGLNQPPKGLFQQPEISIMGFYLLFMENEVWARVLPASIILPGLCTRTMSGGKMQIFRHLGSQSSEAPDHNVQTPIRNSLKEAFAILTDPSMRASSDNAAVYATGRQLLSAAGLNLYNIEPTNSDTDACISTLTKWLDAIGSSSDVLAGILSAVVFINHFDLPILAHTQEVPLITPQSVPAASEDEEASARCLNIQLDRKDALLQAQDANINSLEQQIMKLQRQLQAQEAELEAAREEKRALQENADELLDALNSMSENEPPTPECEAQFPASLNGKKVLTFGGFTGFILGMQEMLPEIIVYQSNRRPEASTLRTADAVFIQTNRVSHSDFYYVLDTCRANGIPVRIYKTAGARTCAAQVVETLRQLSQDTAESS